MTPEKRARMVLTAAHLGAASTALLALSLGLGWPDFMLGLPVGMLTVSLAILLRRKLRDEYFERLWAAGASFAFIAVLAWTTLLPFALGLPGGMAEAIRAPAVATAWTGIVCLAAFFTGFHWQLLRGRA